jgi:hypothetical protein
MSNDYFNSAHIGSTLLAKFLDHPDKAKKEIKPKSCMEKGNIYEARLQEEIEGSTVFSGRYFKSSVKKFPETSCPDLKGILDILESDDIKREVDKGYVYTKPDKDGNKKLSGTYKCRHKMLDEIKANGYRRPVPAGVWNDLKEMMINFKLAKFGGGNLFYSLQALDTRFQVEHYWQHESGAKCRAKWDIITIYEEDGIRKGLVFDVKATENWPSFKHNWRQRYIWQNKHYLEGFRNWCFEQGIEPPETMQYLIAESTDPWLLHIWSLATEVLDDMTPEYDDALARCQAWIDAGRPRIGYETEITVNRWGKEV